MCNFLSLIQSEADVDEPHDHERRGRRTNRGRQLRFEENEGGEEDDDDVDDDEYDTCDDDSEDEGSELALSLNSGEWETSIVDCERWASAPVDCEEWANATITSACQQRPAEQLGQMGQELEGDSDGDAWVRLFMSLGDRGSATASVDSSSEGRVAEPRDPNEQVHASADNVDGLFLLPL